MWTQFLGILLLVADSFQWDYPNKQQECVSSCQSALDYVTFGTTKETDDYYTGYCRDTLKWQSIWLCAKMYCTPYEIKTGVDYAGKPCRTEVHINIPSYDSVIANYSVEAMKAVPIIDYNPEPSKDIINNTVLVSPTYYGYAYRTVVCIH